MTARQIDRQMVRTAHPAARLKRGVNRRVRCAHRSTLEFVRRYWVKAAAGLVTNSKKQPFRVHHFAFRIAEIKQFATWQH